MSDEIRTWTLTRVSTLAATESERNAAEVNRDCDRRKNAREDRLYGVGPDLRLTGLRKAWDGVETFVRAGV